MKRATIQLVSVQYGGSDVGNDLQLSFFVDGIPKVIDTNLSHSKTQVFNEKIFEGLVDANLPVKVIATITELDWWDDANDAGTNTLSIPNSGEYNLTVKVNEAEQIRAWKGWSYTKKRVVSSTAAMFQLTIKATISDSEFFVSDADGKGWLKVRTESGDIVSLPYMLKVRLTNVAGGREYFEILEGSYQGTKASVVKRQSGGSYLSANKTHDSGATAVFNKTTQKLTVGSKSYDTITDVNNPIPNGNWPIEIPDAPHRGGQYYESSAKFATTWFRLGRTGDRYLHPGRVSAGCVTVEETSGWDEIYMKLIKSRQDDQTVGTLTVKD